MTEKIHCCTSVSEDTKSPMYRPMKAVRALRKFINTAVFTERPELSNTAKSPSRQKQWHGVQLNTMVSDRHHKHQKRVISHPSRAGFHGKGWPQWLPYQSPPKRRKLPRQPGHLQSYEDCLPQLPSQPEEEPLVLDAQRSFCVTQTKLLCHARWLIIKYNIFICLTL